MAITDKDKAEIRRLTMLKMAVDSRHENDLTPDIILRAKQFEKYVVGEESNEESRQS